MFFSFWSFSLALQYLLWWEQLHDGHMISLRCDSSITQLTLSRCWCLCLGFVCILQSCLIYSSLPLPAEVPFFAKVCAQSHRIVLFRGVVVLRVANIDVAPVRVTKAQFLGLAHSKSAPLSLCRLAWLPDTFIVRFWLMCSRKGLVQDDLLPVSPRLCHWGYTGFG